MAMNAKCTNGSCGANHHLGARFFGKLGGVAVGSMLGGASKHPVGVAVGALLGAVIGHVIDENVLPRCQSCGAILEVVANVVPV